MNPHSTAAIYELEKQTGIPAQVGRLPCFYDLKKKRKKKVIKKQNRK